MSDRSPEFRKTHEILTNMTELAIREIVKIISEESPDPVVRTIALRHFKNGYGFPRDVRKRSEEFSVLGRIYAEKDPNYVGFKNPLKKDSVTLSPLQEAMVNRALRRAILWAYRFWAPVCMARLVIKGGGIPFMGLHIREYALLRNRVLDHSLKYRELLRLFFE